MSLTLGRGKGKQKRTPAIAAGLTDQVWNWEEVLLYLPIHSLSQRQLTPLFIQLLSFFVFLFVFTNILIKTHNQHIFFAITIKQIEPIQYL